MMTNNKIKLGEKIGYAFGDGAANIAWRGVATFLLIFYTDVYGLAPAIAGLVLMVARFSDGISDVLMGIVGDRTKSKYGNFRPWILWTAVPLAVTLSLLFTTPKLGETGKVIYAFSTYILFTLIYTANNIPYGALMAVMTPDHKERASLGSYRMVGAFAGGMIVQGALLYLVVTFGNVNPEVSIEQLAEDKYQVSVTAPHDVPNANIKTKSGVAEFVWADAQDIDDQPTKGKSFSMKAEQEYRFVLSGEPELEASKIQIINQKKGYSKAIYLMSIFLALFVLVTFFTTKERVTPPANQKNNLKKDFQDLIRNKPWLILLVVGLLFNVFNSLKQGITVIYFTHYLHNQLLAGTYMIALMVAAIAGAMLTAPLAKRYGKKELFIYTLILSGGVNALLVFFGPSQINAIFITGVISELLAAAFPTLFFAMLGDAADFSEWKNGRRATGLVYSAGSFATKFGGGLAGGIIGFVLAAFNYNGQDAVSIQAATPGIVMLMSWVPAIVAVLAAGIMAFYPLNQSKMDNMIKELGERRETELV